MIFQHDFHYQQSYGRLTIMSDDYIKLMEKEAFKPQRKNVVIDIDSIVQKNNSVFNIPHFF